MKGVNTLPIVPDISAEQLPKLVSTAESVSGGVRVRVSSAQILAIASGAPGSGAIPAVPAQGAGKIILPQAASWKFTHVTTPYTVDAGNLMLSFGPLGFGGTAIIFPKAGFLDAGIDTFQYQTWAQYGPYDLTIFNNVALYICADGVSPTGGDGTLEVSIDYRVLSV